MVHNERHAAHRVGLLRALVLGANDGIISTACLVLGVAAANADRTQILTAGFAGLVAGAVSMALGEYVSVSSQRDSEQSDIAKERWELETMPDHELDELTAIYVDKGLSPTLARDVAIELTNKDALKVHLAEELGITDTTMANPMQAALGSAFSFTVGSAVPLVTIALATAGGRIATTISVTTVALAGLGWGGARYGRASTAKPTIRVVIGGLAAMGFTMLVGNIFGQVV